MESYYIGQIVKIVATEKVTRIKHITESVENTYKLERVDGWFKDEELVPATRQERRLHYAGGVL